MFPISRVKESIRLSLDNFRWSLVLETFSSNLKKSVS